MCRKWFALLAARKRDDGPDADKHIEDEGSQVAGDADAGLRDRIVGADCADDR